MKHYYLIGSPIAHSLSPLMMNRSFRLLGIDAEYALLETDARSLKEHVRHLLETGASGWNATMPVKQGMAALCDELSDAARIGGAVNTVIVRDGKMFGDSTDGKGFLRAMTEAGCPVAGRKITLLGTGGAASSILIGCALAGAGEIAVMGRSEASLSGIREIAEKLASLSKTTVTVSLLGDGGALRTHLAESAALVNATSVGMAGGPDPDGCPIPDPGLLGEGLFVYDVVYHPLETPLLAAARARGCRCEGGVSMLIGQGAESFRLWTGQEMPAEAAALVRRAVTSG